MVLYRVIANGKIEWFATESEARTRASSIRGTAEALHCAEPIGAATVLALLKLGPDIPPSLGPSVRREVIESVPKAEFLKTGPRRPSADDVVSPALVSPEEADELAATRRRELIGQAAEFVGIAAIIGVIALGWWLLSGEAPEEYYARANQYVEAGEPQNAISEYRKLLKEEPYEHEARWRLGLLYLDLGRPAQAQDEFDRAIKHGHPSSSGALPVLRALYEQEKYDEVLARVDAIGDDAKPHQWLLVAKSYARHDQLDRAADYLRRAAAAAPDDLAVIQEQAILALWEGRSEDALRAADRALAIEGNDLESRLVRGRVRLARGDLQNAYADFRHATQLDPNDIAAILGRSRTELLLGRSIDASKTLARLSDETPEINYLRAVVDHIQGSRASALGLVRRALEQAPDNPAYLYLLGTLQYEEGLSEEAESTLNQALSIKPSASDIRLLLAVVQLKRGHPRASVRTLEPLINNQTLAHRELRTLAAHTNALAGFPDDAASILARDIPASTRPPTSLIDTAPPESATLSPEVVHNISLRGNAIGEELEGITRALADGRARDALLAARSYRRLHPSNPIAHFLLGQSYQRTGDVEEAKRRYLKALNLNVDYVAPMLALADIARAENRQPAARDFYADALRRSPNNLVALRGFASTMWDSDRERALKALDRVRRADPTDTNARIAIAEAALANGDLQRAAMVSQEITTIDDSHRRAHEILAESLGATGDVQGAIASYNRLVSLEPDDVALQFKRGEALMQAEQLEAARQSFRDALAMSPDHLPTLQSLGALYVETGELEAIEPIAAQLERLNAPVST
ncbi:MAG: tetratricopeptide repeat protein [Pseudomonadota bacterium]